VVGEGEDDLGINKGDITPGNQKNLFCPKCQNFIGCGHEQLKTTTVRN